MEAAQDHLNARVPDDTVPSREDVFADQVDLLYRYAGYGLAAVLINAALAVGIFWGVLPLGVLKTWFAANLVAVGGACLLIVRYRRARERRAEVWWTLFGVGAVAIGALWGATGVILQATDDVTYHVLMLLLIASMAVGAVPFLSAAPGIYYAFVLPALIPFAASLVDDGSRLSLLLAFSVLLYTGLLAAASRHVLRVMTTAIADRRAKEHLLDQVVDTKRDLEQEVDYRRDAQRSLADQKSRLDITLASIADAVITTDVDARIDYLNDAARALLGPGAELAQGRPVPEVLGLDDADRGRVEAALRAVRETAGSQSRIHGLKLAPPGGGRATVSLSVGRIDRSDGDDGIVLALHDVSGLVRLTKQLEYYATHDMLTGLPNRHEFENRCARAIEDARHEGSEHIVCVVDVDHFKVINDTCGHPGGDYLLQRISETLGDQVRASDVVARLGGDEFAVLLRYCARENATRAVQAIVDAVRRQAFRWEEHDFDVSVSVGACAVSRHTANVPEVLAMADTACYVAKNAGRNRARTAWEEKQELASHHHSMERFSLISRALKEGRLRLHYQEIFPMQGEAAPHFELLLRVVDDHGHLLGPGHFIGAAEQYHLMPDIDRWVLSQTLGEVLPALAGPPVVCNVNISGQSLNDPGFLDFAMRQLEAHASGHTVCFEITETAAVGSFERALEFMMALRERGCLFALDDFGTGLSSFSYLQHLPVDFVKIDGVFVDSLSHDTVSHAIVEAVGAIARAAQAKTVAECVDSEDKYRMLAQAGVDFAQGFWLSRPQPLEKGVLAERLGREVGVLNAATRPTR